MSRSLPKVFENASHPSDCLNLSAQDLAPLYLGLLLVVVFEELREVNMFKLL